MEVETEIFLGRKLRRAGPTGKDATNFGSLAVRTSAIMSGLVFKPGLRSRKPMDCRAIRFSLCPKHKQQRQDVPSNPMPFDPYLRLLQNFLHKKTLEKTFPLP
jgi:hypothetical protein